MRSGGGGERGGGEERKCVHEMEGVSVKYRSFFG